jgi:hypothetical protein
VTGAVATLFTTIETLVVSVGMNVLAQLSKPLAKQEATGSFVLLRCILWCDAFYLVVQTKLHMTKLSMHMTSGHMNLDNNLLERAKFMDFMRAKFMDFI